MPPSPPPESFGAIVLAGGFSRRMGEPKALLSIGGETLVERVVARLRRTNAPTVVVAQEALALPALPTEVRVIRDPLPDGGPLVALAAGLAELEGRSEWAFVCAVDAPFVSAAVIARMLALRNGFEAVVPRFGPDSYPLVAFYATSLAAVAADLVREGERRARVLAQRAHTRFVSREELLEDLEVARDDPHLSSFISTNTPEDWRAAVARASAVDGRPPKGD